MIPDPSTAEDKLGEGGPGSARDGWSVSSRADHLCMLDHCDRPQYARGLCTAHWQRQRRNSTNTSPIGPSVVVNDAVYAPCPDDCLDLAAQVAENDARAIFRVLWRAIAEWHLERDTA